MPIANRKYIVGIRHKYYLTQEDLAHITGLSRSTISKAENGHEVEWSTILALQQAFEDISSKGIDTEHMFIGGEIYHGNTLIQLSTAEIRNLTVFGLRNNYLSVREICVNLDIDRRSFDLWVKGKDRLRYYEVELIARYLSGQERLVDDFLSLGETSEEGSDRNDYFKTEQYELLLKTAEIIPDQNPLVRLGLSSHNKLTILPAVADGSDYDTIDAIKAELRAPIQVLKERYSARPNTPQASLFGPLNVNYDEELSKDPKDINYAVLFARGSRFYAARMAANRQVSSGEWPEPDASESEAIETICNLHGPLIMASAVGRQLVIDAREYETTPQQYRREQKLMEEFGSTITSDQEIFEAATANTIKEIIAPIENDPQPARSRRLRLLLAGACLTPIIGGLAWLSVGGTALTVGLPLVASVGGGMFLWEAVKKTQHFKDATDGVANRTDGALSTAEKAINESQIKLFNHMKVLIEGNINLFRRVASLRPEFGWAKRFISEADKKGESELMKDDPG